MQHLDGKFGFGCVLGTIQKVAGRLYLRVARVSIKIVSLIFYLRVIPCFAVMPDDFAAKPLRL